MAARIYEAAGEHVDKETTFGLSREAPCGATSIFPVPQAVADHQGVCSGRRRQYTPKHGAARDMWRRSAGSIKGKVLKMKREGGAESSTTGTLNDRQRC